MFYLAQGLRPSPNRLEQRSCSRRPARGRQTRGGGQATWATTPLPTPAPGPAPTLLLTVTGGSRAIPLPTPLRCLGVWIGAREISWSL